MEKSLGASLKPLLEQISTLKSQIDALRPLTLEQEGRIMQKFRLDWNYHSNAIEGNSLTYGETVAFILEGLTAKGKPLKDHLDIRGHNLGIDYIVSLVKEKSELTEKVIRELHQIILVEPYPVQAQTADGKPVKKTVTLGAYKTQPNHVKTASGLLHYYATPEETPAKMADLVQWLRDEQTKNELDPVVLAALFHYRFVDIHPFDDGNGRMSRLLMNLLLMQQGYPPVVIKQQEREAYYYALRQADAGELADFLEFIADNLKRSLEIQLKGARNESLEEEDDLDKEIALLKMSLNKPKAVAKNKEILFELIKDNILPLFRAVQSQCRKLDDLFTTVTEKTYFGSEPNRHLWETQNWYEFKQEWFDAGFAESLNNNLFRLDYGYHWVDFEKTTEPFALHFNLSVLFDKFKYSITASTHNAQLQISKLYYESLSPEELTKLSQFFVSEALKEIKKRTGQ